MEDEALARLLDRRAIEDALVCYARALDDRAWERLHECFAPDARVTYGDAPALLGVDAVARFCRRVLEPLDGSQHRIGTLEVSFEGADAARSRCYFAAEHLRAGGRYTVGGSYLDRWRRAERGWRIAERALVMQWTDGDPRVVRSPR